MGLNGLALQYVPDRFKKNEKFMLKAVVQNANALQYVNADLIANKKFASDLVRLNGMRLANIPFKDNRDVVTAAMKQNPLSMQYADAALKADPGFLRNLGGVILCITEP